METHARQAAGQGRTRRLALLAGAAALALAVTALAAGLGAPRTAVAEEGAITSVALTIAAPSAGQTADNAVTAQSPDLYGAEMAWFEGGSEEPFTGAFEAGKAYTARLFVNAQNGGRFDSDVAVTVNGAAVTPTLSPDNPSVLTCTVSYTVEDPAIKLIEEVEVVYSVPDSASNGTDEVSVSEGCQATMQWADFRWQKDGGTLREAVCTVTITPLAGYRFSDGLLESLEAGGSERFREDNPYQPQWERKDIYTLSGTRDSITYKVGYQRDEASISGSSSGCTIVSLFGDAAPETEALRGFRDTTLSGSAAGQALTAAYYQVSPAIAAFLQDNPDLQPAARAAIGWAADTFGQPRAAA